MKTLKILSLFSVILLQRAESQIIMNATGNPELECINVDNAEQSNKVNGWIIESFTRLSENCDIVALDDPENSIFSISPNPANTTVIVQASERGQLYVYDTSGQLVMIKKELSSGRNVLDISRLSSRIYIFKFTAAAKTITQKIILN